MSDKEALAQDWKNVGDDMRVAMGMKRYQTPKIYPLDDLLKGILTLNPFGTMLGNDKNKYR